MKILITGGSGFVGKSLIESFKNVYQLSYPTSSELDLTNTNKVKEYFNLNNFDFIINCAVRGGRRIKVDTEKDFFNNIKALDNILKFKQNNSKLITFSSGAEIYKPETFYGFSKKISTDLIKDKKNIKNLRIFNVFGELGMKDSFIYSTIEKCLKNQDVIIWENILFDIYYINDLVNLIQILLKNNTEKYEEIDCVYQKKYKLNEIANLIKEICNSNSRIFVEKDNNILYTGNYQHIEDLQLTSLNKSLTSMATKIKNII